MVYGLNYDVRFRLRSFIPNFFILFIHNTIMPRRVQSTIREDFYETPEYAILPILKYINPNVKVIWEPTHGNGAISNILIKLGYTVIKTDMYPKTEDTIQFDFLNDTPTFYFDCIIFNPPFSNKTKFLEMAVKQCHNTSKQFIFICPLTVMETPSRSFIFNKHKLSIINLSKRVQYMRKSDT